MSARRFMSTDEDLIEFVINDFEMCKKLLRTLWGRGVRFELNLDHATHDQMVRLAWGILDELKLREIQNNPFLN
jgi:hypothetical protein